LERLRAKFTGELWTVPLELESFHRDLREARSAKLIEGGFETIAIFCASDQKLLTDRRH